MSNNLQTYYLCVLALNINLYLLLAWQTEIGAGFLPVIFLTGLRFTLCTVGYRLIQPVMLTSVSQLETGLPPKYSPTSQLTANELVFRGSDQHQQWQTVQQWTCATRNCSVFLQRYGTSSAPGTTFYQCTVQDGSWLPGGQDQALQGILRIRSWMLERQLSVVKIVAVISYDLWDLSKQKLVILNTTHLAHRLIPAVE